MFSESEWAAITAPEVLSSSQVQDALTWRGLTDYESTAEGWVYLLWARGTDRLKVGFTRHPIDKRVGQIRWGSPYPIELVGAVRARMANERTLHRFLRPWRVHGEWFAPEGLVLKALLFWFDVPRVD